MLISLAPLTPNVNDKFIKKGGFYKMQNLQKALIGILSEEPTKKLFEYIALLEKTNEELVKTLKRCVELLTEFKSSVPDSQKWQQMLDVFKETIKVGEKIVGEKTPN